MGKHAAVGKKWIGRLIIGVIFLSFIGVASIALSVVGIDYLVDIWWFEALGYKYYYLQRLFYRYIVFGAVSVTFFSIFFLNFWLAVRDFKHLFSNSDRTKVKNRRQALLKRFQTGSAWFYGPLSLVLSIPIALPLYQQWESFLFYVFGVGTGIPDTYLGKDISYYLFSYPIYTLIQRRLFLAVLILGAGLILIYLLKNHLLRQRIFQFGRGAKWHLSLMVLIIFGFEIWDLMLQRYSLIYDTSHQALFYGPGYVQMNVIRPLIWLCMGTLIAAALALVGVIQFQKGYKALATFVLIALFSLALRHTDFLPQIIQTYVVQPNEITKESPYIAKHIKATLTAYKLDELEIRTFARERFPAESKNLKTHHVIRNIPVWDAETLADVFHQLQELRTYYTFPVVSVGRYKVRDEYQQVFLSPREIEFSKLPGGARNWINEHMTYTHGFGAVMTPASQMSGESMTWLIHNIPPESRYGFTIEEPRIYYGLGQYNYSIAPNGAGEMDYPKGDSNVMSDYRGRGGVPISSLFRKFMFSYYLKNKNIFFSAKITDQSRLLFRRNILERIKQLTPYLLLDKTPYVTVTKKGIYWIVDAYTTASTYPGAAPYSSHGRTLNYARNAVKIVVDAYHGSVDYYIYDETDPIINTYRRIYPGLFKSKDRFPKELGPHIRYPKDLFNIQMQVYAKYHQRNPKVFYQQEDLWTFPEKLDDSTSIPQQPYYATLDVIESGQLNFVLLLPMFPKERANLRAMAVAGCDPSNYGKIIIYDFPKGELVYGPAQIDALINQDPDIAQQFTLWDQAGSQVIRGKMIILPVKNSMLFIQPVYLKATSRVNIPELQRIIMSEGQVVVMANSVHQAYSELQQRVKNEIREEKDRFSDKPDNLPEIQPKQPEARPEETVIPSDDLPENKTTPQPSTPLEQNGEKEVQNQKNSVNEPKDTKG